MTTSRRLVSCTTLLLLVLMGGRLLTAQGTPSDSDQTDGVTRGPVTVEKPDPLKRPLSDKEKRDQQKALKAGVEGRLQEVGG